MCGVDPVVDSDFYSVFFSIYILLNAFIVLLSSGLGLVLVPWPGKAGLNGFKLSSSVIFRRLLRVGV